MENFLFQKKKLVIKYTVSKVNVILHVNCISSASNYDNKLLKNLQ